MENEQRQPHGPFERGRNAVPTPSLNTCFAPPVPFYSKRVALEQTGRRKLGLASLRGGANAEVQSGEIDIGPLKIMRLSAQAKCELSWIALS
jgi:hypothetical protein